MLIYVETKAKSFPLTQRILGKFPWAQVLEIDHYKNIFDKNIGNQHLAPAIILATQDHIPILPVPENYGRPGKSFFFKTSLNCVFDCEYCYLKANFKTQHSVIFVNYDQIKEKIKNQIHSLRTEGYQGQISFYASNYSDIQGIDMLTEFNQTFIPFFEQFDWVLMETRTKSPVINSIFSANEGKIPQNTEFSFSFNPEEIIRKYEKSTAPLSARIAAVKTLISRGYKVGLRFLPLLPVANYENLYRELLRNLRAEIDFSKISSVFIASLIYNPGDFKQMQKKNPNSDLWSLVRQQDSGLVKIDQPVWEHFLQIFAEELPGVKLYFDYI